MKEQKNNHTSASTNHADIPVRVPCKRSRVAARYGAVQANAQADVQAKGNLATSNHDTHSVAQQGISGSGSALPHVDSIQQSFGTHDVRTITAHVGTEAAAATASLGAQAYATGNQIAFANSTPDLHTAAHEAAHVIQQKGGVQLKDGLGQQGDVYERHADAVADRVVAGESAQDLLDTVGGGHQVAAKSIQMLGDTTSPKPKKSVSGGAMARLQLARDAIRHTKSVFEFGAGNQASALRATKMNSYFRMKVMRDGRYWELAPSVQKIAAENPTALTAAKADLAQGGNCGEHATVAFDYLRVKAAGQTIQKSAVKGLDHAFVLIGDLGSDSDAEICVSDPWPTNPTATLWEDHFAFSPDRALIQSYGAMTADGKNVKKVIAAGLKLTPEGERAIQQTMSEEATEKTVKDGLGGWVWEHADTAAEGSDYDYVE